MIEIAIVEDQKEAADLLTAYLQRFAQNGQLGAEFGIANLTVTVFNNGSTFLSACHGKCFDILFLDIGLPDIDGMRIAEEIRKNDRNVIIVFITDMAQFALKGYKVDALDFIVKPVAYNNFCLVMKRAISRIERRSMETVTVRTESSVIRMPIEDITYVEVINHKLIYHTKCDEVAGYGQMKDIEPALSKAGFLQISRYYLVNLRHIRSVKDFTLDLGNAQLQISVRKRREVLMRVAEYFGE